MRQVMFLAEVSQALCVGCKRCEDLCPTAAIQVVEKKAVVDREKCVACNKCWDICPENAVFMVPRTRPLVLEMDLTGVDPQAIAEMCKQAYLVPDQPICPCGATSAKEVAAALLKGAKSMAEITLMTGARSGCGLYCLHPIMRLLKAHDPELVPEEGRRLPHLWNVPQEIIEKYPGYYIHEDREHAKLFEEMFEHLEERVCPP